MNCCVFMKNHQKAINSVQASLEAEARGKCHGPPRRDSRPVTEYTNICQISHMEIRLKQPSMLNNKRCHISARSASTPEEGVAETTPEKNYDGLVPSLPLYRIILLPWCHVHQPC